MLDRKGATRNPGSGYFRGCSLFSPERNLGERESHSVGQPLRPAGMSAWGCEAILSLALDLQPLPGPSLPSLRRPLPVSRPAQCPLRVQTALPALNTRCGRSRERDCEEPGA